MGTSRKDITLGVVSVPLEARPPGSNSNISAKEEGCRWSIACRFMVDEVDSFRPSCAVTTTSPSALTSA